MGLLTDFTTRLAATWQGVPPVIIGSGAFPLQTDGADDARLAAMDRAWAAYAGDFPAPLKPAKDGVDDAVTVNLLRPIVTATVHFLFGRSPTVELPVRDDGEAGAALSPAEAWLAECLRVNDFPVFCLDTGTNGALGGTAYARIDPVELGGDGFPRFYPLDPRLMTICTDPDDCTAVIEYCWTLKTGRGWQRQRTTCAPDTVGWWITDESSRDQGKTWAARAAPVFWNKPYPPILHCKNLPLPNNVYGQPDLTDNLIRLNKAINFNRSNRQRIDKLHGHPVKYVSGVGNQKIDFAVDTVINLPTADGKLNQLAPAVSSDAAANLGREIYEALCEESSTPSIVLGRADQAGDPSGIALRVKLWPLLMKTETKKVLYGPFLVELLRRVFDLGGQGDAHLVSLTWPEPLPLNAKEERETVQMDLGMGVVSKQTVAGLLGYNWENEQANLAEEAAEVGAGVVPPVAPSPAPPPMEGADGTP